MRRSQFDEAERMAKGSITDAAKTGWRMCGLVTALTICAMPVQAQSILGLLANSMNAELPRSFGNHTRLMHVTGKDNMLGFEFEVAPQSPLAKGIDVKKQAASLCKVEMFRSMMSTTRARLHVTYRRPDYTPLGEFTIDKSVCRS